MAQRVVRWVTDNGRLGRQAGGTERWHLKRHIRESETWQPVRGPTRRGVTRGRVPSGSRSSRFWQARPQPQPPRVRLSRRPAGTTRPSGSDVQPSVASHGWIAVFADAWEFGAGENGGIDLLREGAAPRRVIGSEATASRRRVRRSPLTDSGSRTVRRAPQRGTALTTVAR
jgi:hypothetical protein